MSNQSKETQSNSECKKPIKHEGNRISFCLVVFFFALLKSETNFTQPQHIHPFLCTFEFVVFLFYVSFENRRKKQISFVFPLNCWTSCVHEKSIVCFFYYYSLLFIANAMFILSVSFIRELWEKWKKK